LENLGKINVFFGKNNSGKSSILEAISLLNHDEKYLYPDTFISGVRDDELKYLFHNLNTEKPINLSIDIDSYNYTLELRANTHKNGDVEYIGYLISADYLDVSSVLSSTINTSKVYVDYLDIPSVLSSTINTPEVYKEIIIKRKDKKLLEFLKKIDDRIEEVQLLDKVIYFGLKEVSELLPIKLMGDGVKHIFNILASIINGYEVVLIDEIENGLHYTAHKELWISIMKLQEEFDFQMFITTHSLETLKALKEVLEDEKNKDMRDEVKAINIVHTKKAGIKAYNYDFKAFQTMIDTETEIR
jgi:AAA15 family ATPase/GTPase